MAWHLDAAVIRGNFDCRERGRASGRVWLVGRNEPLELALTGDPWADLAGRVLEFENPATQALPFVLGLARHQGGMIGDCTASKKVKVLGVAVASDHWRNGLQLEWFGPDGRVMIESVTFRVRVSKESAWAMTTADEAEQRKVNARTREAFVKTLREDPEVGTGAQETAAEFNPARGFWAGWGEEGLADFAAAIDAAQAALGTTSAGGAAAIERQRNAAQRLERIRAHLSDVARVAAFCTLEGMFEARWGELVRTRVDAHVARIDTLLRELRGIER